MAKQVNPWLAVPLEDYEDHMRQERVAQLGELAALFQRALELRRPESVAVLGIAGGNGLEHVDPAVTRRILGLDVNPRYLAETARRSAGIQGLELRCIDLAEAPCEAEPVQLVHAALIFEHAGLGRCLENALALAAPGGSLSVVLQLPSETEMGVGDTGCASIGALRAGFQLIDPKVFRRLVESRGFRLAHEDIAPVASGKAFWFAVFDRT